MNKYIDVQPFVQELFDEKETVRQGAEIIQAILTAHSPRLSDLAREMKGTVEANYKRIQRFLKCVDPRAVLGRLYQENAPFVIGDPTEMPRPQAYKTGYVGKLSDGETYGYWLFLLATPYRGRALPCGVILYSSNTIRREANSRNLNHFRAFGLLKDMIGEKPLVLDREFSYLELLENLVTEQINPEYSELRGRMAQVEMDVNALTPRAAQLSEDLRAQAGDISTLEKEFRSTNSDLEKLQREREAGFSRLLEDRSTTLAVLGRTRQQELDALRRGCEAQLARLDRDVGQRKDLFVDLAKQFNQAVLAKAQQDVEDVRLGSPATPPETPQPRGAAKAALLASIVGGILGLGVALVRQALA